MNYKDEWVQQQANSVDQIQEINNQQQSSLNDKMADGDRMRLNQELEQQRQRYLANWEQQSQLQISDPLGPFAEFLGNAKDDNQNQSK